MSLTSSLHIGQSALTASQIAIQVAGNNFANVATPGYSRQIASLESIQGSRFGNAFIGRGVRVSGINRQIDIALQSRLWGGISQQSAANTQLGLLSSVEGILNELTENDLSSELSAFFNAWSELANSPSADGARTLVVQQGRALGSYIRTVRSDLSGLRAQVDRDLAINVVRADQLLEQVAELNSAISITEAGNGSANSLRDQRDQLLTELAEYVDITAVEQPNGSVNVLVGSTPIIVGNSSRGLQLDIEGTANGQVVTVQVRDDDQVLDIEGGRVGALLSQRGDLVDNAIAQVDAIASQLIFQVNRLHSAGYGAASLSSITGTQHIDPADVSLALNDPANESIADLPYAAENGSFFITVFNAATGQSTRQEIEIDLDGINALNQPGFEDDTSVADIAASINAIDNLTATVNPDGTLSITAATGYEFQFSEDSSGALAVLGVNTFFTGSDASDIDIRLALQTKPGLLSSGLSIDGVLNDNATSLAIAQLGELALEGLDGESLRGAWINTVQDIGIRTNSARTRAQATGVVRSNLEAQRAAVSGVNLDEESINLLTSQRQYQGSARFISVIDELTQTLLSLV